MSFKNKPIIIEDTYANIATLKSASKLTPQATYYLTDKEIYLNAATNNEFEVEGKRMQWIVKDTYYTPQIVTGVTTTEYIGIYGQAITVGTVPVSVAGLGGYIYRAIWGGQLWQRNTTGVDGAPINDYTLNSAWSLVTPTTATNEYRSFDITYNFATDFVRTQADWKGNILFPWSPFINVKYTDWGNEYIVNNRCGNIVNNYAGPTWSYIVNNSNKGSIYNNSNGGGVITNNSNNGSIFNNSNNGGITNNSNLGSIQDNSNIGDIFNNSNANAIGDNSNAGVINYNSNTDFIDNNSNNGHIYYNSNNGRITSNSSTGVTTFDIINNSNNGYINRINSTANITITNLNIPYNVGVGSGSINRAQSLTGKYVLDNTLAAAVSNSSNTVYTTIWSIDAIAGETYKLEMIGTYQTVITTTGIKIKLGGTAVCNVAGKMYGGISNAAVATELSIPTSSMTSELVTTGVAVANTPHFIGADIIFKCTTSGTINITMASEVNTSAAQLNIGTTAVIERIA